ncbi:nicotinamide mononucleotide adenylyltransferase [Rhizoctonia solani]|uniref:Nicotinamide mononucleotide adenylyltransferase n=1 Tax=Rhizoctonia solani TaxID=456999 RepID=A0A8H8P1B2_9AGAM|nr:nicotinamide mononucleotide adenylyltransferase [Rhizoctonia solani]QRW23410.1 nicotinamide mononucleotide adenylyltransferase [Rhizoctonia solani]
MAETRSPVPPTPPRADSFSTGQTLVNQTGQTAPSPYEKHRLQEVTVEGYRTLGVVSTFIAGVESQCIGLVSDYNGIDHPRLREASSALLLIGLSLSTLGAALSLLSARWFDLLRADQLKMLEYRWDCAVKKAEAGREKHNSKVGDTSKAESTSKEASKDDSLKDSHTATPNIRKHIDEFNASNWRARWRDNLMAFAIRSPVPVVFW